MWVVNGNILQATLDGNPRTLIVLDSTCHYDRILIAVQYSICDISPSRMFLSDKEISDMYLNGLMLKA